MDLRVHFSQSQHSSILAFMSTFIWKNVRWLLLLILMTYAFTTLRDLPWRWPLHADVWPLWFGLGFCCFAAHFAQALMTCAVVACCGERLGTMTALKINVLGGLWGLLLPLGSLGYKAIYLKRVFNLGPNHYGKCYLWASLVNLGLGCCAIVLCWWTHVPTWTLAWLLFVGLVALSFKSHLFKLRLWSGLEHLHLSKALGKFVWVQALGLLVHVCMYGFSLALFGVEISPKYALSIVVFQSWLFLVPLVPGNLVLLESLVAWVLLRAGVPLELSIAATLLNRAVTLIGLLTIAPWAQWTLPKPSELGADVASINKGRSTV